MFSFVALPDGDDDVVDRRGDIAGEGEGERVRPRRDVGERVRTVRRGGGRGDLARAGDGDSGKRRVTGGGAVSHVAGDAPSSVSAAFVVVVVPATTATLLITNMTYPVSLKVRE